MALTAKKKKAILARHEDGERLPAIFRDLEVSEEDRQAFRKEHKVKLREQRLSKRPEHKPEGELRGREIVARVEELELRKKLIKNGAAKRVSRLEDRIERLKRNQAGG